MITFNVYDRVFLVRYKGSTGTAFTIDVDGRQYLLSAHHVFAGIATGDTIDILQNSDWVGLDVRIVGIPSTPLDVIVLALNVVLSPSHPLPLTRGGVYIGQDVHFVGFPFGMRSTITAGDGFLHIPLVKRACLSGSIEENGGRVWLLDGFNNPGFSGGPVICSDPGKPGSNLSVFGIISGYRFSEDPVYTGDAPTPFQIRSNTGIIFAYSASIAIDIIAANPVGKALSL